MTNQGNFVIKYDKFNSQHKYEDHYHNCHEIVFVEEGSATFIISGKEYNVEKNSIVFISNFDSHKSIISSFPYKRYFILLDQKFLSTAITDSKLVSIFKQKPFEAQHVISLDEKSSFLIKSNLNAIYKEAGSDNTFNNELIHHYLNITMINLYRESPECFPKSPGGQQYEFVSIIEKYIEDNFSKSITLKEVANKFNCDMYYLSHLFKKATGYGFKEYLINHRILKAKELLQNTNEPISQVCLKSGFNNINHFIRIFKSREEISPLQYRKRVRGR